MILSGGRDQLAAAPEALRHRPGAELRRLGIPVVARPARASARTSRTTSSSTSRSPASSRSRSTRRIEPAGQGADRPATGSCAATASARPTTSRPAASSAAAPASRYPDLQYPLPAARGRPTTAAASRDRARLPGPCRADALEEPRLGPARARPTRATRRDPLQLHEPRRTTGRRCAPCVRLTREIFAQPAFDPYRGREIQPGADVDERRRDRRLHPRQGRERLPPLLHLPDGPRRRPDGRGRPRGAGASASSGCASSTPRSCRRSPPATSTRRRS